MKDTVEPSMATSRNSAIGKPPRDEGTDFHDEPLSTRRERRMEPVFYVMAILGCGDGSSQCREARVEPVRYQSVQQCRAELPAALARNTDLSFPTISASCRPSGAMIARTEPRDRRG